VFISGSTAVDFDAIAGTCEKALFVAVDLESRFDLFEVYTRAVAGVNLAVLVVHVVDELMPPPLLLDCVAMPVVPKLLPATSLAFASNGLLGEHESKKFAMPVSADSVAALASAQRPSPTRRRPCLLRPHHPCVLAVQNAILT
jgi:hypothetical protein